jgi:CRP-like cAMP-binding protein
MTLKKMRLFRGIDPEEMEGVANIYFEEKYTKDIVLSEKGEESESLYILEQGVFNLVIKKRRQPNL